jgi:hypothetical protein
MVPGNRSGIFITVLYSAIHNYLYIKKNFKVCPFVPIPQQNSSFFVIKIVDYQYVNKFIDLEVQKTMRHHKLNNDEIE